MRSHSSQHNKRDRILPNTTSAIVFSPAEETRAIASLSLASN
ncbi:hypothetical protein [Coleofasciculus sp. FACHB-129]|nr:hypothetical protein [Coleofasciculus sp. FACHB-129]